jgi:hypothetical protein
MLIEKSTIQKSFSKYLRHQRTPHEQKNLCGVFQPLTEKNSNKTKTFYEK